MWGGLCDRRNGAEASIVDDRESGAVDRVRSGDEERALGRERQSAMAVEGGKFLLAATLPESPKFVASFGDGESNFTCASVRRGFGA